MADVYTIQKNTLDDIGDAIREMTGGGELISPGNMPDAIRSITAAFDLPGYWEAYLEEKVEELKTKIANATNTTAIFGYFSDSHIRYSDQTEGNAGHTGQIMRYLSAKAGIKRWIFGGDALSYENTEDLCDSSFDTVKSWLVPLRHIVVKGNHDLNPYGTPHLTDAQYKSKFFSDLEDSQTIYYYVDDAASKTRYIVLDTRETSINESITNGSADEKAYAEAEVEWLYATLNSTPANYQIIVLPHVVWWGGGNMASGSLILSDSGTDVVQLCGDYNARSSGTKWGKAYNFANAVGKVGIVLCGHTHIDYSRTYNNVPVCSITSDSYAFANARPDSRVHQKGTITEQAIDIWFVDTANGEAETVRIGCGPDRVFNIGGVSNGQVCKVSKSLTNCTINNAATTAKGTYSAVLTATEGDFVNGNYAIKVNGYTMNTACATLSNNNKTLTVSISPLVGDVEIIAEAATQQTYTITNNLTKCSNSNAAASIVQNSSYTATITPDSGYQMLTLTVTMGGTDITSTAVSGGTISIASVTGAIVITGLAEEITSYTNVIRTSQEVSSTEIYNGGLGYKNGFYLSQGNESANASDCCTGCIPYVIQKDVTAPTDVLYIKFYTGATNASHTRMELLKTNKSLAYETNGFLSGNSWFEIEALASGYYKMTPKSNAHHSVSWDIGYVRFSFAQPNGSTLVITKNEPI